MGRGLSDLQQCILQLAAERDGLVLYAEILEAHYGWKPRRPIRPEHNRVPGGQFFDVHVIGRSQYQAAHAALARACARLERRGLILRGSDYSQSSMLAGAEITDAGRESLSVKHSAIRRHI